MAVSRSHPIAVAVVALAVSSRLKLRELKTMNDHKKQVVALLQEFVHTLNLRNRSLASFASVLFLLPTGPMNDGATAAEIILSYTEIVQQVRPERTFRLSRSVRLSLRGGNVITSSSVWTNRQETVSKSYEGRLGTTHVSRERDKSTWSVKDSKTLVRTVEGVQHISVITVTTQSDTSCSVTVSYALKPGFREYLYHRQVDRAPLYVRSISAENLTCRINP